MADEREGEDFPDPLDGGGGSGDAVLPLGASAATSLAPPSAAALSPSSHLHQGSISRHLYLDEELVTSEEGAAAALDGADAAAAGSGDAADGDDTARGRPRLRLSASGEGVGEEPSANGSLSSESSSGLSSPVHAERRVDVSDAVKLSSILSMHQRQLENRFLKDFVPLPPPHAHVDTLVAASLAQFSKPIVQVVREQLPYVRYSPRHIRLLDYEIDEQVKAKARLDQAKDQLAAAAGAGGGAAGRRSRRLQDLFHAPNGSDAADANAGAAASVSSSTSGRSFLDLDDGRYEQLGSADELVDVSLFSASDDDVAGIIKREQAASCREGLFWRYSPQFDWSEAQSAELQLVKRQAVAFWTSASHHAKHFLLSVQSLRFSLGNIEPLYATLSIYDLRAESKCSEDFHFDLNDPSLLTGQAQVEHSMADPLTTCKHALFSLTEGHVHEQVVLVLKVERVLQGDPAEMEVYLKSKLRTAAELASLAKKCRANLVHLSDYRQPFAWGLLPLFSSTGQLRTPHGSVRMDRLYLQTESLKEDLFIVMAKEALQDGGKKQKPFPASTFDCRIDALEEGCMPANRVDPSCIPLKNTPHIAPATQLAEFNVATDASAAPHTSSIASSSGRGSANAAASNGLLHSSSSSATAIGSPPSSSSPSSPGVSSSVPVCREVLDFTTSTLPIPANGFVNLLYVYPESIRFDRFRNIACRVQLRQSDSHVDPTPAASSPQTAAPASSSAAPQPPSSAPPSASITASASASASASPSPSASAPLTSTGGEVLKVLLGKSSSSSFTSSALTQVNYHKKAVTPQDEVKVMLPLHLTPTFHLFFTFYKVSCTTRPGQREIIGYAVLPLYTRHRLLSDDVYALPIAAKLPRGYLLPYSEGREDESIHFRQSGAKVFSVRIRVQSSIFNTDEAVNHFIQTFPNVRELQAIGADKGRDLCAKAVEAIPKADPLLAIRFLPSILDHLLDLLMLRSASFQSQFFAFQALTLYIHRISGYFDETHRCPLIMSYIHYRLSNRTIAEHQLAQSTPTASHTGSHTVAHPPLYAVLSKVWLAGLSSKDAAPTISSLPFPSHRSIHDAGSRLAGGAAGVLSGVGGVSLSPSLSSPSSTDRLCVVYSWFYLECLAKSMALERCDLGRLSAEHRDDFLLHFGALVDAFVLLVGKHRSIGLTVVRQLVGALAAFLLDLFAVVEKNSVVDLIERFLVPLRSVGHDPVLLELKFVFHSIITDYSLYWDVAELHDLDLHDVQRRAKEANEEAQSHATADSTSSSDGTAEQQGRQQQPADVSDSDGTEEATPLVSVEHSSSSHSSAPSAGDELSYRLRVRQGLLSTLRSSYRLCALLIDDVVHHLSCKEAVLRDQVIDCLRLFLTKTDYDQRWRSAKPLIATALFPLIPALCEQVQLIAALEPRARRNVLAPFLWILHQVPPSILTLLWQCEEAEDQQGLLALLTLALNDFAYAGIRARESEGSGSADSLYTVAPESTEAMMSQTMTGTAKGTAEGGGAGGAGGVGGVGGGGGLAGATPAAYKRDIEEHMDFVHKTKAFGGSRSRLAGPGAVAGGGGGGLTVAGPIAGGVGPAVSGGSSAPAVIRRGVDVSQYNTVSGYPSGSSAGVGVAAAGSVGLPTSSSTPSSTPPASLSSTSLGSASTSLTAGRSIHAQHSAPLSSASSPAILSFASSSSEVGSSAVGGAAVATSSAGSSPSLTGAVLGGGGGGAVSSAATAGSLRKLRASMIAGSAAGSRSFMTGTLRGYNRTVGGGSSQSLTSLHREVVMSVVRYEGALTRLVGRIALSTLSRFLRAFASTLASSSDAFLATLRLLTAFLTNPQPNSFLLSVLPLVLAFVRRFSHGLQSSAARQVEYARLSNAIFRTAAASSKAVRRHAVAVVYQCLLNEFIHKHDLTQLQTQLTMELSRMTEGLAGINERCLQQSFSSLALLGERYGLQPDAVCIDPELVFHEHTAAGEGRAGHMGSASASDFRLCLQTLLGRLTTILGDSMEISRQSKLGDDADSAITEALLCQVADAFSHLPEVRMEWLKRLAKHHQQQHAYAEAGQCYLLVAQLAAERKKERLLLRAEEEGEEVSASELEALDRVICSYYEACVSQLDKAELYEQCSDVYEALLPYYQHCHDYARLSKSHLHLHSVFEKLLEANSKQTRMLGTYYRVGFYGHRFGPRLDGREFIYKQPKITRLSEIATRMKALYSKQLNTAVRILPDSNPVDRTKLDSEDCVLQLTFVSPYFGSSSDGVVGAEVDETEGGEVDAHSNDVARGFHDSTTNPSSVALGLRPTLLTYTGPRPRHSFIEQHSFLTAFKFSTPFTATGKAFGQVTEQQKRNTVLHVQHPFPAILTAQLVVRKTETILSAIESATEDVNARTASILEVIDSPHVNHKAVAQIIQGSVATQVHGGAKEICQAFLRHSHTAAAAAQQQQQQQQQQQHTPYTSHTAHTSHTAPAQPAQEDAEDDAALSSTSSASSPSLLSASATSPSSVSPFSPSAPSSPPMWSAVSRANLRAALLSFLDACSRALEVNSRLCVTDGDREWQDNMDRIYESMLEDMQPFLLPAQQLQQQQGQGAEGGGAADSDAESSRGSGRAMGDTEVGGGGGGASASVFASSAPTSSGSASSLRASQRSGQRIAGATTAGPPTQALSVSFK